MIFRSKKRGTAAEMPFLDHLEELRWRLLRSIIAVLIGTLVGFIIVTRFNVLEVLINPVRPFLQGEKLNYLSPGDPFFITLGLAITVGLILAFPIVVAEVWGFVSPALLPREKRAIVPALYLGLVLFCGGVALAYYIVLPMTLQFMMGFQTQSLQQNLVVGPYISFVVKILLAFGILFELPVVVMVLTALGLLTSKFLSEKRRYAIAGMAVIAAFVTPGDAVTLTIFMMGPLLLLYELSIGLAKIIERRRARSLVESVAIIVMLMMMAEPAGAQQPVPTDTLRPKTTREQVFDRLRTLGDSEKRDTTRADSAEAPVRTQQAVRPTNTQTPADFPVDSMMQRLMELRGFAATQYRGSGAEFSADSSVLVLFGKADQKAGVLREGQSMVADSLVTFDENSNLACGYGKPILSGAGSDAPVASRRVCYNTRDRIGMALAARTQVSEGANWFITGDLYSRERDLYTHDAQFTDCSLEIPHYHFAARQVKIVNNDVLVGRNVTLNFGDVPVFWLPFFMQSLKQGRRSGLLMPEFSLNDIVRRNAGYNRRIKDIGFYWAINDNLGAILSFDWWSNNYTALEGSFDYTFPLKFINGGATFKQFWRNDNSTEFTVAAQHSMEPNERTAIRMDAQYASSSDFIEERSYDPRELRRNIASNLGVNRRFDWGSVSLQASRQHYLTDDRKDLVLPSLGVSLSTIPLFAGATWTGSAQMRRTSQQLADEEFDPSGLNGQISSSFNWGRFSWSQSFNASDDRRADIIGTGADSTRALISDQVYSWNSSLNFQQNIVGTTTFTPSINIGGKAVSNRASQHQRVSAPVRVDVSAALKADLFGFWPGIGALSRIRHRLSPIIQYSYSPVASIDSASNPLRFLAFQSDRSIRERNAISIGVSQTIEGKFKEDESKAQARADSAAVDSLTADPTQPRRIPQARKITILSLSTDAVMYDFVAAREEFRGIQTTQISNSINSDLLRGMQLTISHELFRSEDTTVVRAGRVYDPHLARVTASFSLGSNAWIFRALGLTRGSDAAPPTGSAESRLPDEATGGPAPGPGLGLIGNRDQGRVQQQGSQQRGSVGSWNASFNLTLDRPRPASGVEIVRDGNQMMTTMLSFQPTQMWAVNWSTGYSFTEKEFTDHLLTFTRQMHDWDANFDFVKAQNGNFSFNFRVSLRANPDIKFDYNQRSNIGEIRPRGPAN